MLKKIYGCFQKWWYHQIIHCNRVFRYKPSMETPTSTRHMDSLMQKNIGFLRFRSFPATENSYKRPPLIIQKELKKRYLKNNNKKFFFVNEDLVETLSLYVFFQMWFLNSDSYWPFLSKVGPKGFRVKHQRKTQQRSTWWFQIFFPTCQVRVVRFYVSLFSSFFFFFFSFSSSSSSLSSPPSSFSSINWDPLCSVWRAGPQWQLGSSQFSVACWTPTAILRVLCGVLDPNRDIAC